METFKYILNSDKFKSQLEDTVKNSVEIDYAWIDEEEIPFEVLDKDKIVNNVIALINKYM